MANPTPSHILRWQLIVLPLKSHPLARNAYHGALNFHKECLDAGNLDARLGEASRCKACLKIVEKAETIKGFPENGTIIQVQDEELKALAGEKNKAMDLVGFFPFADVDPKYLGASNLIGPLDKVTERPYMLLYSLMRSQSLGALVTYMGYGRDKIGVIRAGDESLVLFDAFFPAEIRTYADQFKFPLTPMTFSDAELRLARQLVDTSMVNFSEVIATQRDSYLDRVESLKETRRQGLPMPQFEKATVSAPGNDLLAALTASLNVRTTRAFDEPAPTKPPVKIEEQKQETAPKKGRKRA